MLLLGFALATLLCSITAKECHTRSDCSQAEYCKATRRYTCDGYGGNSCSPNLNDCPQTQFCVDNAWAPFCFGSVAKHFSAQVLCSKPLEYDPSCPEPVLSYECLYSGHQVRGICVTLDDPITFESLPHKRPLSASSNWLSAPPLAVQLPVINMQLPTTANIAVNAAAAAAAPAKSAPKPMPQTIQRRPAIILVPKMRTSDPLPPVALQRGKPSLPQIGKQPQRVGDKVVIKHNDAKAAAQVQRTMAPSLTRLSKTTSIAKLPPMKHSWQKRDRQVGMLQKALTPEEG